MAEPLDGGEEIGHWLKAQCPFAKVSPSSYFCLKFVICAKVNDLAGVDFPSRPDEGLPFPWARLAGEKNFDLAAEKASGSGVSVADRLSPQTGPAAVKACRKDAAIVKNY
jgi:hypothetical protein